ncbi:MAG: hypothetical protein Q7U91_11315 [Sideroxyarcus sp.]|nr:hypothetical protein [Sideroxyarcus sp.]
MAILRVASILFLLFSFSAANAENLHMTSLSNVSYCAVLEQNLPKHLPEVRQIADLIGEETTPDLDYCHTDFSKCDIRNLRFKGLELRLLHRKTSHTFFVLSARISDASWSLLRDVRAGQSVFEVERTFGVTFPPKSNVETLCGMESCIKISTVKGKVNELFIDCQSGI